MSDVLTSRAQPLRDENELSTLELYKQIRDQIKHEDGLYNQRMTWLITLQSFLFAAYAVSLSAQASVIEYCQKASPECAAFYRIIETTRLAIAGMGLLSAALTLFSFQAANLSINKLIRKWHDSAPVEGRRKFPQIIGNDFKEMPGLKAYMGWLPTFFFPVIIAGTWVFVQAHDSIASVLNAQYLYVGFIAAIFVVLVFNSFLKKS